MIYPSPSATSVAITIANAIALTVLLRRSVYFSRSTTYMRTCTYTHWDLHITDQSKLRRVMLIGQTPVACVDSTWPASPVAADRQRMRFYEE
eukprot:6171963-Pleurochrysis_carterae.AAC.2